MRAKESEGKLKPTRANKESQREQHDKQYVIEESFVGNHMFFHCWQWKSTTRRLGQRCRFLHEVIQHLRSCLYFHDLPITVQEAFCAACFQAFTSNIQSDLSWSHPRNRTCCGVLLSDDRVTQLETSISQSCAVLEFSCLIQLSHPELVLPSCYVQGKITGHAQLTRQEHNLFFN